ncbi:MAG: hypothetical protein EBT61_21440 [Verrucomicrobia bacterium]|nr:hypothetical protein [Verrucomicrobiota bacterium]
MAPKCIAGLAKTLESNPDTPIRIKLRIRESRAIREPQIARMAWDIADLNTTPSIGDEIRSDAEDG